MATLSEAIAAFRGDLWAALEKAGPDMPLEMAADILEQIGHETRCLIEDRKRYGHATEIPY